MGRFSQTVVFENGPARLSFFKIDFSGLSKGISAGRLGADCAPTRFIPSDSRRFDL